MFTFSGRASDVMAKKKLSKLHKRVARRKTAKGKRSKRVFSRVQKRKTKKVTRKKPRTKSKKSKPSKRKTARVISKRRKPTRSSVPRSVKKRAVKREFRRVFNEVDVLYTHTFKTMMPISREEASYLARKEFLKLARKSREKVVFSYGAKIVGRYLLILRGDSIEDNFSYSYFSQEKMEAIDRTCTQLLETDQSSETGSAQWITLDAIYLTVRRKTNAKWRGSST